MNSFLTKKLSLIILLFGIVMILTKCEMIQKDTEDQTDGTIFDSLSEEDNLFLESVSVPIPPLDSLLTYSGEPFGSIKGITSGSIISNLINGLIIKGHELCNLKNTSYHDDEVPYHWGLAYSSGQRDYENRQFPPYGNAIHKKYKVYGLDCSGFIINLLWNLDIKIGGLSYIRDNDGNEGNFIPNLKKALVEYNDRMFYLTDLGYQSIDKIRSGDLIVWYRHIGLIAEKKGNSFIVLQSNGTGNPLSESSQEANLKEKRGVHAFSLDKMISSAQNSSVKYWGTNYKILRFAYEPYSIEINGACNDQVGPPGKPLVKPISVIVKDPDGNPYNKVKVLFTANNGGSVSKEEVITGSDGIATVIWTLGSSEKNQTLVVETYKSDNLTMVGGSPIEFSAIADETYSGLEIPFETTKITNYYGWGVGGYDSPEEAWSAVWSVEPTLLSYESTLFSLSINCANNYFSYTDDWTASVQIKYQGMYLPKELLDIKWKDDPSISFSVAFNSPVIEEAPGWARLIFEEGSVPFNSGPYEISVDKDSFYNEDFSFTFYCGPLGFDRQSLLQLPVDESLQRGFSYKESRAFNLRLIVKRNE